MIVTVAQAVWRIVRDPNVRIILVSALDDTAQQFTQMIKRQFQYNEHFLRVFPEFRVGKNSQFGRTYDFTHPLRTNYDLIDPTFRSFYLGAPVAGRRCDILIADDPIEKRHVTTPEQADKSLKDFNDLLPILDKSGKYDQIFVIGTRWAFNDIYGALLGESRGEESTVNLEGAKRFESMVRHCLEDKDGKPDFNNGDPILPNIFDRTSLLQVLEDYRTDVKRGEEDWWKQYMNVCISPSGRKFEPEWFDAWIPRLPAGIVFSAILCDSANKDEQVLMRGDYTVALAVHFDTYGHLYVTDGIRSDKLRAADLSRELTAMAQRSATTHGIALTNFVREKVGEDTFFAWVRSEFNRQRMPITVFPLQLRGQGKKVVRIIEALQHPLQGRQIHFVYGFDHKLHDVLLNEATHIGSWTHDDAIDCLSLAFHPDIRVKPSEAKSVEWKMPYNARVKQLSTLDTVPAAFIQDMKQPAKPEPRWAVRGYATPEPSHGAFSLRDPRDIDPSTGKFVVDQ